MTSPRPDHADAVVVGAGASGSVVTRHLAERGLRVVCLEQGEWTRPESYPGDHDEWDLLAQGPWSPDPNARGAEADYPCDSSESDITPLMFNGVGGSTVLYAAGWVRLLPSDFRVATLDGVADDWPLTYQDLAPYYDATDRDFGVSGAAGDPAYPAPISYPLPPLPLGRLGRRAAQGMNTLGWHWWVHPNAIASRQHGPLSPCARRGVCMTGCPQGAKATTSLTHWPKARTAGARLITGARATRVTTSPRGRASGVDYLDRAGRSHHQSADAVILAANGVGTARLLLLSASGQHPDGLANSSGLVGRRLMMHPVVSVAGVYDDDLQTQLGPAGSPLLSYQFYETDPSRGFPRGAKWDTYPIAGLLLYAQRLTHLPFDARVGPGWHETMRRHAGHTFDWLINVEDLPDPANRVTLHPELTDSDGLPAPKIRYRLSEASRANMSFQLDRAREAHLAAGAVGTFDTDWMPSCGWHLLGTARAGHNPATSVVNGYGRSHDVPNLFIVDGSVFVTGGAMNPTSTIAAFALRAAHHLVETGPTP